ncbi:hypothetical protein P4493_04615 [Bacillus thuringiensis]|jgi:hypothetical protein|uniref:Uncharacterized protein n=3 Tax=Bacillus thuringiensis TaxID=1428 RepID=A0A0B5NL16_BACTU|nr:MULTISPECIES: hypothetical protein [Bacillus]MEC2535160.1 hypothetical protein [Bacillus cereus]MED1153725.1 hypothetical protein [Bacillus paranthracis]OUB09403.1 hypothetical protein BK708_33320 [Bacillus thuringiensis serovar yunnanensis]AFQ30044.1 hypothetical protein BTF1_29717 [Bacillus thuringiensis HD-789]AJG74072.1 hypothetical protein BF38_5839 [Bacillus thuringiensis]
MNIVQLLTGKNVKGLYKITHSISESWIGAVVNVQEDTDINEGNYRYIIVKGVEDQTINHVVNNALPLVGAVTTAEFEKVGK